MTENFKNLAAKSLYRVPSYVLIDRVNISMTLKRDEFQVEKFLCHGNKSEIYTARISFSAAVVIKKASSEAYAEKEILNEIHLLTRMKHQNIISIKGARASCLEPFMGRYIYAHMLMAEEYYHFFLRKTSCHCKIPTVLEELGRGTLSDLIEKQGGLLSRWMALDIARQLISALQYLHEDLSPFAMIIHRGR